MATLVALAARRLRLPYTVGLVATGVTLTLLHVGGRLTLTHDLIFNALLPPLIFEAALSLSWDELKRDRLPIGLLSTLGVVISALVTAGGMAALVGWPLRYALVFGVLIAATDPVAVIALFKETGVGGRLRLLVESESLLNDGVAAVLFALALTAAQSGSVSAGQIGHALLLTALGAVLIGGAVGGLATLLAWRTPDYLVETALTTVAAYGSFLVAEHWHVSGVLATVTAGLVMGNVGVLRSEEREDVNIISERGREVVLAFWEFAAFVVNSLIFLLIGLRAARIPFQALGLGALLLAVVLTLAGRALAVYPLCALLTRTRPRVERRHQHVLFWGGLRGALGLALALSLPPTMPYRDAIVIATFGVVAFSVLVQGLTMPWLLKRLGLMA